MMRVHGADARMLDGELLDYFKAQIQRVRAQPLNQYIHQRLNMTEF